MTMKIRKVTVLMMISMLLLGPLLFTEQVEANNDSFHYVALGDSLTVGFEPQQRWDQEAKVYGFVDRIFEQALFYGKTTGENYGVNGLTSTGLKNLLVAMDEGVEVTSADIQSSLYDPRINEILSNLVDLKGNIKEADLITITIGGNDFGARTYLDIRNLDEQQLQAFLQEKNDLYQKNVQEALNILYQLNPEVTIVLTDQYNPFPRINKQMYQKLTVLTEEFTNVIEGMVDVYTEAGFELLYVPVAKNFVDREILYTHILRGDIHPNQRGYEMIAKNISEAIWGVYHDETEDENLTITVKGHEHIIPFPLVNYIIELKREYIN